ncbi:Pentatricopeptide repeat-containing protein [Apostasia shenzhenica]|uniref:Pentatricopeptide repeat-containing protein n=1 Tax=Apostasia shenzhenica TaxID=1088818 RepID=A0A2I0BEX2_9ASPA|nr:Pentatricopeptide repeat-containing protein [Apostasia shenzhenica]
MATIGILGPPQFPSPGFAITNGGNRRSHRLLSSLSAAADFSSADRLLRKFVASSSKPDALQSLSLFISLSSPFSLLLYQAIADTPWFRWNPKLAASVVSLLEEQQRSTDAEALISRSTSRLRAPRDLPAFYCELIDAFSCRWLQLPALRSFARLREIPYSGRKPYESIIKGLCSMGMATDAEELLREMAIAGFRPSAFEFRSVAQAYGRSGAFADMTRVFESMQEAGIVLDTVSANIALSCYGDHFKFSVMVSFLRKMRESGIIFSLRTFNSVLNSCPSVVTITKDLRSLPLSMAALLRKVEEASLCLDEALLIREVTDSSLMGDMLQWSDSEGKLDLHGFHLASAYVMILMWIEVVRDRLSEDGIIPLEISIICGSGKNSRMKGDSPLKKLVSEMMFQLYSPMKMDRKNVGKFVAKGKAVKDWLW